MEFKANDKPTEVVINGTTYMRHAIKTHFVHQGECYLDLFEKYILPICEAGDIISCSEKVIALCQNRVVHRDELKIGFWADFLSRFASHPASGVGVGESIKMQYAISKVGLLKVLYASAVSAVTKLFGRRGVFYEIVGADVSGLDGFYDHVWDEYRDIGIEMPENPGNVCNEARQKLGIHMFLVDANDLGQELLGYSDGIPLSEKEMLALIHDNPAGQGRECTPFILIRKKSIEI